MGKRWIGVDFDGTLATYEKGQGNLLGAPIGITLNRVKKWLASGEEVRIFTARASSRNDTHNLKFGENEWDSKKQIAAIREWCIKHIGMPLQVTAEKDFMMKLLVDDRAVSVERNTGYTNSSNTQQNFLWNGNAD